MKIVLANLPWRQSGKQGVRAGSRWPHLKGPTETDYLPFPFFLAYAAALLKKHDFKVTLIDAIAQRISYRSFLHSMRTLKPDLLVCEVSTVTLEHDLRLLSRLGTRIHLVLCGPDVNIRSESFLKQYPFVRYVLVGEYEFTLLELVKALRAGRDLASVAGLIYRNREGIHRTPLRSLTDLNALPWPLREGLPMYRYNDSPGDIPLPSAQMLASRGCPFRCKFCLWPQVMYHGHNYRTRDIVDVVDEMEFLTKEMKFKSIYFDDDTFNIGKDRMLAFCAEIKKRKLDVPWAIMARADLMDEEILQNMKETGLYAVKYGVESSSQALLDGIDKNMNIKRTEEIIKFTKMLDIKTHLTFTFGLPGETRQTIQDTTDFALRLDPETVQFSIATPFPGTDFYKEMDRKGALRSRRWSEYDGNHRSVIHLDELTSKDLTEAVRYAYGRWVKKYIRQHRAKKGNRVYYYLQLIWSTLKKDGVFMALFKTGRFFFRRLIILPKERLWDQRRKMRVVAPEKRIRVGRLEIIFEHNEIEIYWGGMKLTQGAGLVSEVSLENGQFHHSSLGCWDFERQGSNGVILKTKYGLHPVEEIWKINVPDEKQIEWKVSLKTQFPLPVSGRKIGVVLSERYRQWVDSWGEGGFPGLDDFTEVKIRNPRSEFVGLRGRKRWRGQLPTVLLEYTKKSDEYTSYVNNASVYPGARMVGVKTNGHQKEVRQDCFFFSGHLKIVEEDFRKRKSHRKK